MNVPGNNLLTFDQVCEEIEAEPKLLLGNGFSVSCDRAFEYDNLKDKVFEKAFEDIDIEEIMFKVYGQPEKLVERLKEGFINAIGHVHPVVPDEKIKSCKTFLNHFSKVYTLNYDLLLYWAINRNPELQSKFKDGFGFPQNKRRSNWPNAGTTSTFYLHGSLFLHCPNAKEPNNSDCPRKPSECCIEKFKRYNLGGEDFELPISLITIIKNNEKRQTPHFVSEGDEYQKYQRIMKCTYLKGCYDAIASESGDLVIFGASFSKDLHILRAIKNSSVERCYVSIHNDNYAAYNEIASKLNSSSCTVIPYKAETANIWNN